ncbi:phage portal protein [Sphingomonas sp. MMS24-J13]|uniref:phage portal protein n=1 Tax=Sphingomonas sp. MMS24-J13 TaxID=3238686 RepID=UPI0038505B28
MNNLVDGLSGILRLGTRVSADRGGTANAAGEYITDTTVLSIAAAWACINLVAGTSATLPLMVYRNIKGGREVATDHWLYRILHDDPNADQTAVDFLEYTCVALELRGNGYAEKLRGAGGQVIGLDPIPPGIVSKSRREDGMIEYRWTWNGKSRRETSDNVLHIRGFGGDPMGGMSPLEMGAETFGHARALSRASASIFRNAMRPSGVWQTATKLTSPQIEEIEGRLAAKYQGATNAGRPLVMGNDLKWQQLSMTPDDLEMIAGRQLSVVEVCMIYGVPPHMIGHTAGNTQLGSSITEQTRAFEKYTLRRRLKRIEASLRKQLLTPEDIARGITIEFSMEGLLRGSSAERSAFYNAGLDKGWLNVNEVRAWENLSPVPGGDINRVQMQNVPLTMTATPTTINATPPAE